MYAEEHLEDGETEISDYSTDDSMTINSVMKERRKIAEQYKKLNPDFYKYKTQINGETVKVELYSTPVCSNAFIRHAINGSKCPHRAASKYEDLYFIVNDTTTNSGPRKLYYYSPEEFERHQYMTVPQRVKEDWQIRNMRAHRLYNY